MLPWDQWERLNSNNGNTCVVLCEKALRYGYACFHLLLRRRRKQTPRVRMLRYRTAFTIEIHMCPHADLCVPKILGLYVLTASKD